MSVFSFAHLQLVSFTLNSHLVLMSIPPNYSFPKFFYLHLPFYNHPFFFYVLESFHSKTAGAMLNDRGGIALSVGLYIQ